MPDPLPIQARHDVKRQCAVDRAIAARVDATAKKYDVPRACVPSGSFPHKEEGVYWFVSNEITDIGYYFGLVNIGRFIPFIPF